MLAPLSIDDVVDIAFAPSASHTRADYAQHIKIISKAGEVVPFVPNRVQAHYLAHRGKKNLNLKPRQVGMSSGIVWKNTLDAMEFTCHQAVLAHDSITTDKLRTLSQFYYYSLPDHMRPKRSRDNATKTTYEHTHSEVTIVTAGSFNIGRGGTYHRVHGSEVAFWKDASAIISGLLQGLTPDGQVDFESTANGAQGYFYEQCMKAMDGDPDWAFHFYPWYWTPEYALALNEDELHHYPLEEDEQQLVTEHGLTLAQIKWRRSKQRELPFTFAQEFPETPEVAFILSGESVFGNFRHALYTPDPDSKPKPIEGHRYVAGIDWGQDPDYTVISIMDGTDDTEVYLARLNRDKWKPMRAELIEACIYWNVETIEAEKNSMGSVNIEDLKQECWDKGYNPNIRAITTTNKDKRKWVANLYKGIHEDGLQLLDPVDKHGVHYATRELSAFTQTQTDLGEYRYSASGTEHDDTVMARLLAYNAVNKLIG